MTLQQKLDQLDQKLFALYEARVPVCEKAQQRHMDRIAAYEEVRKQATRQGTPWPKGLSLEVGILVVL